MHDAVLLPPATHWHSTSFSSTLSQVAHRSLQLTVSDVTGTTSALITVVVGGQTSNLASVPVAAPVVSLIRIYDTVNLVRAQAADRMENLQRLKAHISHPQAILRSLSAPFPLLVSPLPAC